MRPLGSPRSTPPVAARAMLAIAFLVLQFVVPAVLLFGRRPARFGWQMFAAHTNAPAIAAEHTDGSRALLRVDDYFAFRRGDLDPAAFDRLPAHVCAVDPTVTTVYMRRTPDAAIEPHPCR
jgi:hypothetical protein